MCGTHSYTGIFRRGNEELRRGRSVEKIVEKKVEK